ncbi:hypothetical protein FOC4_g10002723 [Fusarium odoratissimum]|uniref:F-box domain-containing protein n=1 Tax=Fusarium oxysporum f. sp. cubense (strain race 4) TaxID=2502994 RepID=N1SAI3_FUSC4|nr:hypothetical protein FOC4_g10002723 [Fusarium odoratissimum]
MANPSFTHLFSCPEEIIDIVCQQLCPHCSERASPRHFFRYEEPKPTHDRKCLLALSLTCKELRHISQPHLYHRPMGHDFFGFIDTIAGTPALGRHVKELCLNEHMIRRFLLQYADQAKFLAQFGNATGYFGERRQIVGTAINCLMSVAISLTPMLNKLEIHVESDWKFSSIPSGCLPNLKKLTITVSWSFPTDDLDGLAGLLDAAPRLERIELVNLEVRDATKKPKTSFCHDTVNEITLRSCMLHISQLEAIMRGFPKLQTFRIGAPNHCQRADTRSQDTALLYRIEDLLMLRSDTLKHLTLHFPGIHLDHPGEIVLQDLSGMKVLETLYIDSGMLHRRWQGHRPGRRICQLLPTSIKEFGLMGSAYPLVHDEVLESINISASVFPLLKKVVVAEFGKKWLVDGDKWERMFTSACEAHNLELSSEVPRSSQGLALPGPYRD